MGMMPNAMGVVGNRRSTEDFEFGDVLGEGSYSTVSGLLFSRSLSQDCVNETDHLHACTAAIEFAHR